MEAIAGYESDIEPTQTADDADIELTQNKTRTRTA